MMCFEIKCFFGNNILKYSSHLHKNESLPIDVETEALTVTKFGQEYRPDCWTLVKHGGAIFKIKNMVQPSFNYLQ